MIPIKIGWIFSNCGRSSGHTRNGLSGMVDGTRMHSRLKNTTQVGRAEAELSSTTHWS